MAALYPAEYLNLKKKGRLLDGFDADFVVLDEHQFVKATYIAGNAV